MFHVGFAARPSQNTNLRLFQGIDMCPSSMSQCIITARLVESCHFYAKQFDGEREGRLGVLPAAVNGAASTQRGCNV